MMFDFELETFLTFGTCGQSKTLGWNIMKSGPGHSEQVDHPFQLFSVDLISF